MRLAIDLDGVVADFVYGANSYIQRKFGHDPIPATDWNWFKGYPDHQVVWRNLWEQGVAKEHLMLHLRPIPGAVESLKRLSEDFEILFCTHRPVGAQSDTHRWLAHHGLLFPVFFVDDPAEKVQAGCDLYLDDYGPTVEGLLERGAEAVLYRQPWNEEYQETLPGVDSWAEFEWVLTMEWEDLSEDASSVELTIE